MTADIVSFPTSADDHVPADVVLNAALKSDLKEVLIIGVDKAGAPHFASSSASKPLMLWWLEQARQRLLSDEVE